MNRLYGTHADLKRLELPELRACSYSMIRAKRVPHVMGVEEEAVRLAERWGGDEGMAARAAILHDCTKYLELDDQAPPLPAVRGGAGMSWNSRR